MFQSAAAAYRSARLPPGDRRGQAWAAWGEALSSFAYGAHEGSDFERVAALIGPDAREHAAIFGLFLSYLPAHDATRLGDVTAWRERVTEVLGADPAHDEGLTTPALERDFAHQMATIGRPDIASRFFMNRIRLAKGRPQERRYLRMLVPFVRDYCGVISFRLSPASGWVRREAEGYDALLDFLDNLNADGRFVGPGEVVVPDGSRPVYSALSPEEDCAAAQAVYGIADAPRPGPFIGRTPDEERDSIVAGLEVWVRAAMTRSQPAPSVVPYLKLVWLEWFAQAFEMFRNPAVDPLEFRYSAIDASALTAVDRVRELRKHPAATPHQKGLIGLFLDMRAFFEEMYP